MQNLEEQLQQLERQLARQEQEMEGALAQLAELAEQGVVLSIDNDLYVWLEDAWSSTPAATVPNRRFGAPLHEGVSRADHGAELLTRGTRRSPTPWARGARC